MAAMSQELLAVLGSQWIPAADALIILCALGTTAVLSIFTGPLLQALGRPRRLAVLEWSRAAVDIAFLGLAALLLKTATVNEQVTGIAWARFVPTVFLMSPVFIGVLMYFCKISIQELTSALASSFFAGAGIFASIFCFRFSGASASMPPFIILSIEALIGGMAGFAILMLSDRSFRVFVQRIGFFALSAAKLPSLKRSG
jgi:hypothetical protein